MAAESVDEASGKSSLILITNITEVEFVQLCRALSPAQREALSVLMGLNMGAALPPPWAGWKGVRA